MLRIHIIVSLIVFVLLFVVCIVSELGTRYKSVDAERSELKGLVADNRSYMKEHSELLNKYRELEDAHMIQSKLIHKMQKKMTKIDKYVETVEMQENVIKRMQYIIESSANDRTGLQLNKAHLKPDTNKFLDEQQYVIGESQRFLAEKEVEIFSLRSKLFDQQQLNTELKECNEKLSRGDKTSLSLEERDAMQQQLSESMTLEKSLRNEV